jgi:hypothetical protein
MICDHYNSLLERCANTPNRAPRLVVPCQFGRDEVIDEYRPLRMFTTLHFCELHTGTIGLGDLLTAKIKREFEAAARKKRALDFKCDFEKAELEWVLTTTPEYRRFMAALGHAGIMGAAKIDQQVQELLRQRLGVTRLAGEG